MPFLLHDYVIHHGACQPILLQLHLCSSQSLQCYSSLDVLIARKPMAVQIYHYHHHRVHNEANFISIPNCHDLPLKNNKRPPDGVLRISVQHSSLPGPRPSCRSAPRQKRDGISCSRLRQPQILYLPSTTNSSSIITHHSTMYKFTLKYENI